MTVFEFIYFSCYRGCNSPTLQQITDPVDHTEGPSWDERSNLLYFVDIHTGRIFTHSYHTGNLKSIQLNGEVSPVIQTEDPNYVIVGLNRSIVSVEWNGTGKLGAQTELTTVAEQYPDSRFNDGKADKSGRLWLGKNSLKYYNCFHIMVNF